MDSLETPKSHKKLTSCVLFCLGVCKSHHKNERPKTHLFYPRLYINKITPFPTPFSLCSSNSIPTKASYIDITMEGITSSPPTVGQQLDAFLEGLQNLDSTHKYLVAFATCLAVSFVVLNSGQGRYLDVKGKDHEKAASQKKDLIVANDMPQKASATGKESVVSGGREPRWYIFKIMNYVLATSFLASVVHFLLNSEEYIMSNDHIKTLGAVWTLFVLYFWGFFGVSFVDTDEHLEEEESPSSPPSSNHKVAAPENVST